MQQGIRKIKQLQTEIIKIWYTEDKKWLRLNNGLFRKNL